MSPKLRRYLGMVCLDCERRRHGRDAEVTSRDAKGREEKRTKTRLGGFFDTGRRVVLEGCKHLCGEGVIPIERRCGGWCGVVCVYVEGSGSRRAAGMKS